MTNKKTHTISFQRTYIADSGTIFNLFKDATVFKLTGANDIQSDFKTGKSFRLTFNNRGTIHGQFIKITDNDINMEWNVDGFQRPKEIKTSVEISLHQDKEKCILILNHKNIVNADVAVAKQKAWTEILDEIEQRISNNRKTLAVMQDNPIVKGYELK